MLLLNKKKFFKKTNLSDKLIKKLIEDIPILKKIPIKKKIEIKNNLEFYSLAQKNWKVSTYQFSKQELNKLSSNPTIEFIKKELCLSHNIKHQKIYLSSVCIFLPSRSKYVFDINNQRYIYHKYHLDSAYKLKALILLTDSKEEDQQFSYIKEFPESELVFLLKRMWTGRIIVFLHKLCYFLSLKKLKLSGQPPELPLKYQNQKLYKKFNSLKKGDMITFHNLYPHSSHNGYSNHKSPMLQLVFDKI